jgi:hypothetical protein
MFQGCKMLKTYWAVKPGSDKPIEVVLEGKCGDRCGYVSCVETGDRWMTYGYPPPPTGNEVTLRYQYSRESSGAMPA